MSSEHCWEAKWNESAWGRRKTWCWKRPYNCRSCETYGMNWNDILANHFIWLGWGLWKSLGTSCWPRNGSKKSAKTWSNYKIMAQTSSWNNLENASQNGVRFILFIVSMVLLLFMEFLFGVLASDILWQVYRLGKISPGGARTCQNPPRALFRTAGTTPAHQHRNPDLLHRPEPSRTTLEPPEPWKPKES